MTLNDVRIEDTFAEAFGMTATRVIITALEPTWARHAAASMTGFATSVIGCGVEAGIERELTPDETPDGRPGLAVLLFATSGETLEKQLEKRIGQCVLTCPTTAVFAGLDSDKPIRLGRNLRYFGDGFQISKRIGDRRYWRVPVMDGEFLIEEGAARTRAVGGGNFLLLADSPRAALAAAEAAVAAIAPLPEVITPFPGGVVRSGSKVGSKYQSLIASTNDAYCPTLVGLTDTALPEGVTAVLEVVIDGLTEAAVAAAMRSGIRAACELGPGGGLRAVTAGNYGGKLGPHHFHLRELLA
ncbi:MAG: formylmethanofuran--tetrahydromethanopterin N-formyltransferase [Candidatus Competibacterales bacterium]|nr:formylmethanofuran--tetrahydromethanopterin N-formyltransferase [Candidatus Competibacterales bacterium]